MLLKTSAIALSTAILVSGLPGCASFTLEYRPKHDQQYQSIANNSGLEVRNTEDLREEKEPRWDKPVGDIVADALVQEMNHSGIFRKVSISQSRDATSCSDCSHIVDIRVKKFRFYNDLTAAEIAGAAASGLLLIPGLFIAASIPTEYVSEVEVEFEVFDAESERSVFVQSYSDTRSLEATAYTAHGRTIQQTSDALEQVIKRFVLDLTRLPLSQKTP